ncbi:MAG: hypothetical protein Q4B58_06110 [Bacteroidales bacterium]|nr:hypothetical protein [Bacteroidales bacterium]
MIKEDPSKALTQLDSLYEAESHSGSDDFMARYVLLRTYACYRQGIDAPNDSLLCVAEEFLAVHGTDHERMLCYFLHGQNLVMNRDFGTTWQLLALAAEYGEACQDHFMLGQIYTFMFTVCTQTYDSDMKGYARRALDEYTLSADPIYVLDGEVNLGVSLYSNREYDASEACLKSALSKAEQQQDTFAIVKCIRTLAYIDTETDRLAEAQNMFQLLFETYHAQHLYSDYAVLAYLCAQLQDFDTAQYYLALFNTAKFPFVNGRIRYLRSASKVYALMNDYERAYQYCNAHQMLQDSVYWNLLSNSVMKEQRDYIDEKLVKKEKEVIYLCIFVLGLLFVAVIALLAASLNRNKRVREEEQRRHAEEKLKLQQENAKNVLRMMKQSSVVAELRENLTKRKKASVSEWKALNDLFCENLPSFEGLLREKCDSLREEEWEMCMLEKLEFAVKEIDALVGINSSVTSHRLAKKYLSEDAGATEWRAFIKKL